MQNCVMRDQGLFLKKKGTMGLIVWELKRATETRGLGGSSKGQKNLEG